MSVSRRTGAPRAESAVRQPRRRDQSMLQYHLSRMDDGPGTWAGDIQCPALDKPLSSRTAQLKLLRRRTGWMPRPRRSALANSPSTADLLNSRGPPIMRGCWRCRAISALPDPPSRRYPRRRLSFIHMAMLHSSASIHLGISCSPFLVATVCRCPPIFAGDAALPLRRSPDHSPPRLIRVVQVRSCPSSLLSAWLPGPPWTPLRESQSGRSPNAAAFVCSAAPEEQSDQEHWGATS